MDSTSNNCHVIRDKSILLLLNALLIAHLVYGWKYIQPPPMPEPPPAKVMPEEPQLFDWLELELFSSRRLNEESTEHIDPFRVAFELPAPEPEKAPVEEAEPVQQEPPPPPPPPPWVVTIRFNGVYVSMSGKNFILLDITDSKSGKSESVHITAEENLPGGIRVAEVTGDWIDLVGPDGTPLRIDFSRQGSLTIPQK